MADTYLNITGKLVKLIDLGDGTFGLATNVAIQDGANAGQKLSIDATGAAKVLLAPGTALAGKFVPVDADGDEKFTAANPALVTLSGSIPEYGWLDTDDEPTPLEPAKLAFGVEINTTTHVITTKYWNGPAWQEVL